jgi:hypothetical protein
VVLRVAAWLPRESLLAMMIIVTGVIGLAGNLAYGFDTIHMSLGDVALVHRPGAANLIKPYGLFFPLSVALVAGGWPDRATSGRPPSSWSPPSPGRSPTSPGWP